MGGVSFTLPGKEGFEVWWPVTVQQPGDNGVLVAANFKAKFAIVPASELKDYQFGVFGAEGQIELLNHVLREVEGVALEDGTMVTDPSHEAFQMALGFAWFRNGFFRAYEQAQSGAAIKN